MGFFDVSRPPLGVGSLHYFLEDRGGDDVPCHDGVFESVRYPTTRLTFLTGQWNCVLASLLPSIIREVGKAFVGEVLMAVEGLPSLVLCSVRDDN